MSWSTGPHVPSFPQCVSTKRTWRKTSKQGWTECKFQKICSDLKWILIIKGLSKLTWLTCFNMIFNIYLKKYNSLQHIQKKAKLFSSLSLKGQVCLCPLAWLPFPMSYSTVLEPGPAHGLQMCCLSPTWAEGDTLLPSKNLSFWLMTSFSLWRKWREKPTNNSFIPVS